MRPALTRGRLVRCSPQVDSANSTSGPFGPFSRDVALSQPVDITVPVEMRMGLGILEFRFQKGFLPPPV